MTMRKDALIAELRANGGPAALELAAELESITSWQGTAQHGPLGVGRARTNAEGRTVSDIKLKVTLDLNVIWPEKLAELLSLIPGVQSVGPA